MSERDRAEREIGGNVGLVGSVGEMGEIGEEGAAEGRSWLNW